MEPEPPDHQFCAIGANARVNYQSIDNSINIVLVHTAPLHTEARTEIEALELQQTDNLVLRLACERQYEKGEKAGLYSLPLYPSEIIRFAEAEGVSSEEFFESVEFLHTYGYITYPYGDSRVILVPSEVFGDFLRTRIEDFDAKLVEIERCIVRLARTNSNTIRDALGYDPGLIEYALCKLADEDLIVVQRAIRGSLAEPRTEVASVSAVLKRRHR